MQREQGDLAAALTSFQASLAIRDRLAKADPGNTGWQRDLSASHIKIGDVQRAQGDLGAALTRNSRRRSLSSSVWRQRTQATPSRCATSQWRTSKSARCGRRRATLRWR